MSKSIRTFFRGTAMLVLALSLAGCENPSGPTGLPDRGPETVRVNGVDLLVAPAGMKLAGGTVEREIGIDGGAIEVDGGRLVVPPGALGETVTISMSGPDDSLLKYTFGPSGLVFDTAATLTVTVDLGALGIDDPDRLKIAGASDAADDWTVIGGTYDEVAGTVVAPIEHFSLFGLCLD